MHIIVSGHFTPIACSICGKHLSSLVLQCTLKLSHCRFGTASSLHYLIYCNGVTVGCSEAISECTGVLFDWEIQNTLERLSPLDKIRC